MNVWYISKYASTLKYGANSRQFSFCKSFKQKGINPTLIIGNSSHLNDKLPRFEGEFFHEIENGVNIIWINLPKYKNATSVKRFWTWVLFEYKIIRIHKKFSDKKPDVVIASSLSLLSIISALFIKNKYAAKFVLEVRDIWPQTLKDLMGISVYNPIYILLRQIEKRGYKCADNIVGTMPGLHKHVTKTVNADKVVNIPQGVDLEFYSDNQEELDIEFINKYFPKDKFIITYAGTLGISYALDKVVEAAIKLEKINPDIHFLLLGDGIEKEKLLLKAEGLSNITFVPRINKSKVLSFLSKSDILLHSFQMKKVFEYGISPNKFIDYMYSARPIIVMFSGYPSLINDAKCGEFIPSEDVEALINTIEKYYNLSKEELNLIGNNGKEYLINNLTFDKLSDKYIKLFK